MTLYTEGYRTLNSALGDHRPYYYNRILTFYPIFIFFIVGFPFRFFDVYITSVY